MIRTLCMLPLIAATWAANASATPPAPTFGGRFAFTEQTGESIYRSVCAGCHMQDGRGATGAGTYPSLLGDERLAEKQAAIAIVLHGQRAMPPFGRSLTSDQVAAVVAFIRTNFGNAYPEPVVAADVAAAR
jgi:mono/diheme cytochrome c family protein